MALIKKLNDLTPKFGKHCYFSDKRFGLLFKRGILFFERKYLFGGLCGVAFLFKRVWRLCRPALP